MDIIRIIQETATWIEKVNPDMETNLYRTAELSPGKYYYQIPGEDKDQVVENLTAKRSAMLRAAHVDLIPVERLVDYGRIMFFEANETVVDGAPEDASAYFIDIGDAPPWDAWIATERQLFNIDFWAYDLKLTDKMLVAWIPKLQYFYAQQAVEVACIDNFEWPQKDCVADKFCKVKYLFTKPPMITEPALKINFSVRQRLLYEIMHEAESYSKMYYNDIVESYKKIENTATLKQPFWKRLFKRSLC